MARSDPFRGLVVVGLALAAFSLAACTGAATPPAGSDGTSSQGGGGPTTPPTAGEGNPGGGGDASVLDACKLLTQEEIKAQFNVEVAPPVGSRPGESSPICNWSRVAVGPGLSGVSLTASELDQGYFDYVKANAANAATLKEVTGLGDAAFFESAVNPFTLDWQKGNHQFNLYVQAGTQSLSDEANQQLVVNLANDVLAHL